MVGCDGSCPDVCYCIYTFGYHRDIQLDNGRKPVFIKAQTSENAVAKAYEVIRLLSPDFVTIHNGFGFDMKRLAAHSSVYAHVSAAVMKDGLLNT